MWSPSASAFRASKGRKTQLNHGAPGSDGDLMARARERERERQRERERGKNTWQTLQEEQYIHAISCNYMQYRNIMKNIQCIHTIHRPNTCVAMFPLHCRCCKFDPACAGHSWPLSKENYGGFISILYRRFWWFQISVSFPQVIDPKWPGFLLAFHTSNHQFNMAWKGHVAVTTWFICASWPVVRLRISIINQPVYGRNVLRALNIIKQLDISNWDI